MISNIWFRFAQFFIKPLMSPDATMREIRAVNSGKLPFEYLPHFISWQIVITSLSLSPENQKNLLSDTWRMDQV